MRGSRRHDHWAGAGVDDPKKPAPVPNAVLTFRDSTGKPYTTATDQEGIYELRHVPPGHYALDSQFAAGRFILGGGDVTGGLCTDFPVRSDHYSVTGRLIPGIGPGFGISLVGAEKGSPQGISGSIASDGRFYFDAVPRGRYYIEATISLLGRSPAEIYYPGTSSQKNAVRISVSGQPGSQSFDFDPDALPVVPIPIMVESSGHSNPVQVTIRIQNPSGLIVSEFLGLTETPLSVLGVRGDSYGISVHRAGEDRYNVADSPQIVGATATKGMKAVHLFFQWPALNAR